MNRVYTSLIAAICCLGYNPSMAQVLGNKCPGCIVNQAAFPPNPGDFDLALKPDTIVVTRGDTFDVDVSLLLPKKANSPLGVSDVVSVEVRQLSSPFTGDFKLTTSQPTTNTYNPQTNRYGCAKACGRIFDQPGVRIVTIPVNGCISAGCQIQNVSVPVKILPNLSLSGNDCFSNPITYTCGPDSISFSVKTNAPCIVDATLNPCKFKWDFGAGFNDSSLVTTKRLFSNLGKNYIKLRRYRMKYVITKVVATESGTWWCGDVEEVNLGGCQGDPDMVGNLVCGTQNTLPEKSNQKTATWNNLNIEMTSNLVTVSIKDEDAVSNDDDGGSVVANITAAGVYNLTSIAPSPNSGGVNINITVVQQIKDSTDFIDSVEVYALPDTGIVVSNKDTVCTGDSIQLSLSPTFTGVAYQWIKDDTIFIVGAKDSVYYAKETGRYSVNITNNTTFCATLSKTKAVAVGEATPTFVDLVFDVATNRFFLNPYPFGVITRWFKDGLEITGETGRFLPNLGIGSYYAEVYNADFALCKTLTATNTLTSINDGIDNDIAVLVVVPNPNKGRFQVRVNTLTQTSVNLIVTDILGRHVWAKELDNVGGQFQQDFDLSTAAKGVYFVHVLSAKGNMSKRVIVE